MPMFQNQFSIPAASVNDNVMSGSQWEFLPWNAALEFGLVGDANAVDLRLDVYAGADILAEGFQPSAAARMPIYPDDFTLKGAVPFGSRLKIRVRNLNAGAARSIFVCVRIDPI